MLGVSSGRVAPAVVELGPTPPFIRLRFVLGFLVLGSLALYFVPRGRAAWQLHNRASALADYSLCMVGPTGPELIRAGGAGYDTLLRRRVITAPADARPFASCARFLERLGQGDDVARAHQMQAAEFDEFWDRPSTGPSIARVSTSLTALTELAERAWPFVRTGYARLVAPSSHTEEAVHALAAPTPGIGSGLPDRRFVYRSSAVFGDRVVTAMGSGSHSFEFSSDDGGLHFKSGGHGLTSELSERCAVDLEGRSFTLASTGSGERVVLSHGPGAAPHAAVLSSTPHKLLGVVCDEHGLTAVLGHAAGDGATTPSLRTCAYRGACRDLAIPSLGGRPLTLPLDVARIEGDTIIAVATGGITRVSSSRDQGQTWAPWTVAFDRASLETDLGSKTPSRLLRVGTQVLLYAGAARADQAYYVLVSSDHGASFREPG